ncbi:MAG: rod shape-determining protein MreC [Candidatus Delongbacteria bacterium]|jgi:rod shape-determining protein MreC|nr:rod shape-determining protein MreC [Candidatus Delongbacteria bacterium]
MNSYLKIKAVREWVYLGITIFASVFLILFNNSSFNNTLSEIGLDAFSILRYDYFSLREKASLENEIVQLKQKFVEISQDKKLYEESFDENIRLRNLLSIELPESLSYVYAKVTGEPVSSLQNTLLINAGTEKNVNDGEMVISETGFVGVINNAGKHLSKVTLISDPGYKIPVITEYGKIPGIMRSLDKKNAEIHEITKSQTVEVGEKIFTSDFSKLYHPNLLIGEVISVSDSSATINKKVIIKYSTDFLEVKDVFIIHKNQRINGY